MATDIILLIKRLTKFELKKVNKVYKGKVVDDIEVEHHVGLKTKEVMMDPKGKEK
ncbi:hypothetical protein HAX54_047054, partial [Datura stramonium]|nr:hypothetical protein [Datura stramonium]